MSGVSLAARLCMCGEPSPNSFICHRCTSKLGKELRDVPQLMLALDDSLALLTKRGPWIGAYVKRGDDVQPLPVNLKAGELRDELHMRLQLTVRELTEERGLEYGGIDATIALALWLARHATTISLSDHAETTFKDLVGMPPHSVGILGRCWQHVDRPLDQIFLGPCGTEGCELDLYARTDEKTLVCECTAVHDVPARKLELLKIVRDELMTAEEIAASLKAYSDVRVNLETLRKWVRRGKINPHDVGGQAMYNCGQVLDRIKGEVTAA